MGVIADFFLRAKHWQLFLLVFGILFVGGLALFTNPLSTETFGGAVLYVWWAASGLAGLSFLTWLWSLGSFANSMVSRNLKSKEGFYIFALIYPPLYVAVFAIVTKTSLPTFLVPMHLLAMFCLLYALYFTAKSMVLAESGEKPSFPEYLGTLVLIWLFPVGMWMIQPRVNRLYEASKASRLATAAETDPA